MYHPTAAARPANESLARVLAHAIEAAGKPRHRIANECGMHRETLLRVRVGSGPSGSTKQLVCLPPAELTPAPA